MTIHVGVCACVCTWVQRPEVDVGFCCPSICETRSLAGLELAKEVNLTGHQAQGTCLSLSSQLWDYKLHHHAQTCYVDP